MPDSAGLILTFLFPLYAPDSVLVFCCILGLTSLMLLTFPLFPKSSSGFIWGAKQWSGWESSSFFVIPHPTVTTVSLLVKIQSLTARVLPCEVISETRFVDICLTLFAS